jgi:hypothetical protein
MALTLPSLTARQALPSIIIGGTDILKGVQSQYLLSFSYTDNTTDQADDLSVEIADPKRDWMMTYLPKKGVEFKASIATVNWDGFGSRILKCGTFFVDNVGIRGPPNTVTMRGTSIPVESGIKTEKRTKSWENSELQSIAGDVAQKNGLSLFYDTKNNPMLKRADQMEKADIQYIRERAKEFGLSVKIHDKKLVIYSEQEYEARDAAFTLKYGASNILSYDFNSKADDTYESSENAYVNPETGKLTKTEFTPPKKPDGGAAPVLKTNERVSYSKDGYMQSGFQRIRASGFDAYDFVNDAPAQNSGKGSETKERSTDLAKSKLREKNKKERICTLTVVGNLSYLSGINFTLAGFGIFDDKWFAESTIHEISESGYTTQLKLRTALEY